MNLLAPRVRSCCKASAATKGGFGMCCGRCKGAGDDRRIAAGCPPAALSGTGQAPRGPQEGVRSQPARPVTRPGSRGLPGRNHGTRERFAHCAEDLNPSIRLTCVGSCRRYRKHMPRLAGPDAMQRISRLQPNNMIAATIMRKSGARTAGASSMTPKTLAMIRSTCCNA